jgi:hypothetical protein
VVREDPKVAGLLYAGSDHRVWYTRDGGKKWDKLQLNMPTANVTDMHVKDDDLVVGTSGRSIWILDDLTPVRQWDAAAVAERLYPVRSAIRWRYHPENYVEDRGNGDNPPRGAIINYYLSKKPKDDLVLEIFDESGRRVNRFTSKKDEAAKEDEHDPDAPSHPYKPTILPTEPGVQRIHWNLMHAGPKLIPAAKNDAGLPREGPPVVPGKYTLKLNLDGKLLTSSVEVRLDPRVTDTSAELRERYELALKIYEEIGKLAQTVIELRSVRHQLQHRLEIIKEMSKTKDWGKQATTLLGKLDDLEARLHNPRAAVTYDILAQKGGAKLYSQLVPVYNIVIESDGPVTQGLRDVYADHVKELRALEAEWRALRETEVPRLNAEARKLDLPVILVPHP